MKKDVLYPQGYKEPTKKEFDQEANYQMFKDEIRTLVEAMVVDKPMYKGDIVTKLGKQGAPGSVMTHQRVIEEIDQEWHPGKFEEAPVELPEEADPKKK